MKKLYILSPMFLLVVLLCMSMPCASAAAYDDIAGHWGEEAIIRWSDKGILQGYEGKFRPDATVTRGELAAVVARLLRLPALPESIALLESPRDHWAYPYAVSLAYQRCLLNNTGAVQLDEALTREEAFYIISGAFSANYSGFNMPKNVSDGNDVQGKMMPHVFGLLGRGFIHGTPDGRLLPKAEITRAEIVTILDNMIDTIITQPGKYDQPLGEKVLVCAPDVEISGQNIKYLYVSPAIMQGKVMVDYKSTMNCEFLLFCTSVTQLVVSDWPAEKGEYKWSQQNGHMNLAYYYDDRFFGGAGTKELPYLIQNQAQLELLNEYAKDRSSQLCFMLNNDIVLEGVWTPIGGSALSISSTGAIQTFEGNLQFDHTFDGNGHVIDGLNIIETSSGSITTGLFGHVGRTIKNLTVKGSIQISAPLNDKEDARLFVGGIAGICTAFADIYNCHTEVDVTVSAKGHVAAGGMAGHIAAKVRNSSSSGKIIVRTPPNSNDEIATHIGGLGGELASGGRVTGSSSTCTVIAEGGYHASAGGLIGMISGKSGNSYVRHCYSTGSAFASNGYFQNNAGGFSGQIHSITIESCWSSASTTIGNYDSAINVAGGFASGVCEGAIVRNCYATGSVTEYGAWFLPMVGSFTGRLEGEVIHCYASGTTAVVDAQKVSHLYNTIVGSRRGAGGIITMCVDLTDNEYGSPVVIDEPVGKSPVVIPLTSAQITSQITYTTYGWDFDKVWVMPSDDASYRLPILRNTFLNEHAGSV